MRPIADGVGFRIIEPAAPLNPRPPVHHVAPVNDTYWTRAALAGYVVDETLVVIRRSKPSLLEKRVICVDPAEGLGVFRNSFPSDWVRVGFDIAPLIARTHRADFTTVSITRLPQDSLIAITNLPFSIAPEMIGALDRDGYDAFGCIISRVAMSRFWQRKYVPPNFHLAHQESLDGKEYYCPGKGWQKISAAFQVWVRKETEREQPEVITSSPYFKIGVRDHEAAFGIACASSHAGKIRERSEFDRYDLKYIKRIKPTLVSEQLLRHCAKETDWSSHDIQASVRVYLSNTIMYTVLHQTMMDQFAASKVRARGGE